MERSGALDSCDDNVNDLTKQSLKLLAQRAGGGGTRGGNLLILLLLAKELANVRAQVLQLLFYISSDQRARARAGAQGEEQ